MANGLPDSSLPDSSLRAGPGAALLAPDRAQRLSALRERLAGASPPLLARPPLPSHLPELDAVTRGWARPGINEIVGPAGSGRLGLVLPTLRALAAQERTLAVIDAQGWLCPPGLPGLPLHRLLLVRPGGRALWAAEQLARCGALPLLLLLDPPPLGRGALRLAQAAEAGRCAVLLLGQRPDPHLRPSLRLRAVGPRLFELQRGGAAPLRLQAP